MRDSRSRTALRRGVHHAHAGHGVDSTPRPDLSPRALRRPSREAATVPAFHRWVGRCRSSRSAEDALPWTDPAASRGPSCRGMREGYSTEQSECISRRRPWGIHDVTWGRSSRSARPVPQEHLDRITVSGVGNRRASTVGQRVSGGRQRIPRPCVMSYVCTRVSLTPSAAKPPGSVEPQCHARASGPAAAKALPRSRPDAMTTSRTSLGDAFWRTTRSNGR